MSIAKKQEKKRPFAWTLTIGSVVIIGLAAMATVAVRERVAQFSKITDGTEKYSGIELQAARNALTHSRTIEPNHSVTFIVSDKLQVERVKYAPRQSCTRAHTNDPSSIVNYSVTVRSVGFFGINSTIEFSGCVLNP
jgi:ABC-type nickel/cobalt efflux system permease component RcnA